MKRTGKTIVVEQAIRYLLNKGVNSNDIVLIQYKSVVVSVKDEIDQLISFMDRTNCEYIFVDEVTLLNGFVEKSKGITDYTCKLRIDNNKEIDILIPSGSMDGVTGCIYDVKFSSVLNSRHFKAFDRSTRETYSDQIETGHAGIIYTGETVTLRNGLVAINAHDFLMDIGKYIGI